MGVSASPGRHLRSAGSVLLVLIARPAAGSTVVNDDSSFFSALLGVIIKIAATNSNIAKLTIDIFERIL